MNGCAFNIAIDGPAGAGKSTIARKAAAQLGFIYVDTGAMYRAMALYLIRNGLTKPAESDPKEKEKFERRAGDLCRGAEISIEYRDGEQVVLLAGENVNPYLRTEEVSSMASVSSAVSKVRVKLVELQQQLAGSRNVVMDGRDIGTVVLPDAQVKVYLTASVEVRARRRFIENQKAVRAGAAKSAEDLDLEKIKADIAERDHRDMTRAVSPLKQAEDAVLVDSSELTIDQVTEEILNLAADKLNRPRVITASTAGFCFGVQKAVDTVYREIQRKESGEKKGPINTFGPIIHNETVVEELKAREVGILNSVEEAAAQEGGTIVIRSHGVSKETWEKLNAGTAQVVDSTCTFVKKIHQIVDEASRDGKQIVIIGNHGHAETEGTVGWSCTPATVIETEEEALAYRGDRDRTVCIVAQTTFNAEKFKKIVALIAQNGYNIEMNETICNATSERQAEARRIAQQADVMIVIGGKGSSNTAKLYEICRAQCSRTYFIQTVEDLDLRLSGGEKIIGITAGASTPKNIIEEVQSDVRRTDF
jgi:4-hydroxy-3-methylbut-2-en-1-yl diphosphate reductase